MAKKEDEALSVKTETSDATETVDAPEDKPETQIPKEYEGKSQEELIQLLQEKEQFIGKQGQELGTKLKDLEEKFETYRRDKEDEARMARTYQQPQNVGYDPYGQPIQPDKPESVNELERFNYERPITEFKKLYAEERKREQEQAKVAQRQQALQTGQISYQKGRNDAYRSNPDLYRGIEREVEKQIQDTYLPYANMGVPVDQYVSDPSIWRKVAQNIRLDREEFDHLVPKKPQPIKAVETETPTPAKPAFGDIPGQFDLDMDEDMVRWNKAMEREGLDITPEKRKEILRAEQERLFRGED